MPNWNELYKEIKDYPSPFDAVRKKYLEQLYKYRKRNIISYYSGFLVKKGYDTEIQDADKELFMSAVYKLDRGKGLDLILHTEGGNIASTESIVDYLKKMFKNDIKVFIPQIAMSAGTLIACISNEIFMGEQSNLGPIDPQFNGIPAKLVLSEFKEAKKDLSKNKNEAFWKIRLDKYPPTFLALCANSIYWSEELARKWLKSNMFKDDKKGDTKIKRILAYLGEPDQTFSHGRHIHIDKLKELELKITKFEDDPKLQELILTVHHSYMLTFQNTDVLKIVENQNGDRTVISARPIDN